MHMQGTPQTMQDNPTYGDVVAEVREYLRERRDALVAAGIDRERICLDPGIGFGKTHEHNITLMANCGEFHELGCPLLVGHSRKGFLGKLIGDKEADRTNATVGAALSAGRAGRADRPRPRRAAGPRSACGVRSMRRIADSRSRCRPSRFGTIAARATAGKPTLTQVLIFADT